MKSQRKRDSAQQSTDVKCDVNPLKKADGAKQAQPRQALRHRRRSAPGTDTEILRAMMQAARNKRHSPPVVIVQKPPAMAPAVVPDKLLTVQEAAAYCGVSTKTFRKWRVPCFNRGRVLRFRPKDILAFIAANMRHNSTWSRVMAVLQAHRWALVRGKNGLNGPRTTISRGQLSSASLKSSHLGSLLAAGRNAHG